MQAEPFEDEPTRELPSSLRTFTDLAPVSEVDAADILEVEDHIEHTVRIPRSRSLPAFVLDAPAPPPQEPWNPQLPLVIAAALLVACMTAGMVGVVAGRTLSPRAGAQANVREAREVVMVAACELVTTPPLSAPAKAVAVVAPLPRAIPRGVTVRTLVAARPTPPPPPVSSTVPAGFGHLGSDRDPSARPARR